MLDHSFEEPEEEREREFVDAASAHSTYFHARGDDRRESDVDPLFTTLRIPREQALTRPVLNRGLRRSLAPEVTRATEEERAA